MLIFQKGEIILEFQSSHQNKQAGELNNPMASFICSVFDSSRDGFENTDHLSLLNQSPPSLWAKSPTDGKIYSMHILKVDPSKSFPRINQYPICIEALQGISL